MKRLAHWVSRGTEGIVATLLAAMFLTFLLQIFSRYVMRMPFGWTLELCLILWVWIVFLGNAFVVRERDHVSFDIFYLAAPRRLRQVLALISAAAIVVAMLWSFLPTWDYIDWMKMRGTTSVENPVTGAKIPMRTIFSVYAIFMLAVILRYLWRIVTVLRDGPPDAEHEIAAPDDEVMPHVPQDGAA